MATAPESVPSSVPKSTQQTSPLQVDEKPQLTFRIPPGGKSVVPMVPRSDGLTQFDIPAQPVVGKGVTIGQLPESGMPGAPSVPQNLALGQFFVAPSIDEHYLEERMSSNPYQRVNNPPTRGMWTWVKDYANHVFNAQTTDSAGWQQNSDQQRTSHMRITGPPLSDGYSPESFTPHQQPQFARTQQVMPVTGSDPYGSGVLNRDRFGAGQVAAGQGGANYTPSPGSPPVNEVPPNTSDMPVWG